MTHTISLHPHAAFAHLLWSYLNPGFDLILSHDWELKKPPLIHCFFCRRQSMVQRCVQKISTYSHEDIHLCTGVKRVGWLHSSLFLYSRDLFWKNASLCLSAAWCRLCSFHGFFVYNCCHKGSWWMIKCKLNKQETINSLHRSSQTPHFSTVIISCCPI